MRRAKASPELRGYGRVHRMTRASLAPFVQAGLVSCCRCLRRIRPGEAWDLDHADNRRDYRGAAHAGCNRSAGAKRRNVGPSREWLS
jgi:hypothetical protein